MDDREALARAVAAAPDDDLPRLVFADWLEEHGEPDRAHFTRAQLELAATPPWESFAVRCRHLAPEAVVRGDPWRPTLPAVDGRAMEWHPEFALRRGFAWALVVRDVATFLAEAPRLFDAAPVGQLHLPAATLDQWRRFGTAPWLPRVKSVHFYGLTTPIEPVRVLCEADAPGLEEVVFEVASRPGMPVVLADLLASPLGRRLRSLELRYADETADDLTDALCLVSTRLDRLALVSTRLRPEHLAGLADAPVLDTLTALELTNVDLASREANQLLASPRLAGVTRLALVGVDLRQRGLSVLARSPHLGNLRMLTLARNWRLGGLRPLAWSGRLGHLRSLDVTDTNQADPTARAVVAEWHNLVELNFSRNAIGAAGARALASAEPPAELAALVLRGMNLGEGPADKLRARFGDRLVL